MGEISDALRERVIACGFDLVGWDETSGAISHSRNSGLEFVGTHVEIEAYLFGWMASREAAATDRLGADEVIQAALVSLCGYRNELVSPGAMAMYHTRPQVPFRGQRVVIPDEIAPYFDVMDITVGTRSCMPHAGLFPAVAFATRASGLGSLVASASPSMSQPIAISISERAYAQAGTRIAMPMTQVGMDIGITVANKSDEAQAFECYVIGQTVRVNSPGRARMSAEEARALIGAWQQIVGTHPPVVAGEPRPSPAALTREVPTPDRDDDDYGDFGRH